MEKDRIYPNYKALSARVNNGGIYVCKFHYAADAHKNPEHATGREWLQKALSGYPGGIEDPNWLKEMEIQYSAGAGSRIFPYMQQWIKSSNIFIDHELDLTNAKLYGSYDHGWAAPACYLVHAIDTDGRRITLWEFYGSGVPYADIARIIKGETVTLQDGRIFEGNPYAGKEIMKICDPEIYRENQVMQKGPNKSLAELFRRENVYFTKGEAGDDMTVISWLSGNLWLNPYEPGYQIHIRCPKLIWELGRLQRKSLSAMQLRFRNQPEGIVEKDNHAFDALKYWLKRFPVGSKLSLPQPKQADFNFWRDRKKAKVKMSYVREFAR